MGFNSNWLLVRGMRPQQVWTALGVQPSGVRSDRPTPVLAGSVRPDGSYLLVEDRADEPVEGTWNLAELSVGCEVIGVGEVDGAGGAEVVVWRDGRKVWGVAAPMDDGGPEIWGDIPADILAGIENDALWAVQDDDDDPDYFNAILALGIALTGYQCGRFIDGVAVPSFEILETP
ncbi:hypothetical protein [Nocardia sp. NPDC050710]|uniref:hypothetical protein n=1 Tax=Nocardia sp. NPDC050710 TaxID=3157220 RepID=UPI0033E572A8